MGKKSKKTQRGVSLEHKIDEVLGELAAVNLQLDELAAEQKKSARKIQALNKKLAKMRVCKCGKGRKKKKSRKKDQMPLVASHAGLENSASLLMALADETSVPGDDLKMIAGVGPVLEEKLNGLGVYRYDQIAQWGDAEIADINEHLDFSGRIERENWIEQAKALAKGGRDEYVRVFGKEPR